MKQECLKLGACVAVLLLCGACDSPMPGEDAGPVDAGRAADSGGAEDSGASDSGGDEDAGSGDSDSDGVPDAMDCDPADAAAGATATRACTSACGSGEESCTDGVWEACDAPTDCVCDEEGATRIVDCGMCGDQGEMCVSGMWEAQSECLTQGECMPAAVEDRTGDRCAHDQRLCQTTCEWGEWSTLVPMGTCDPGTRGACFQQSGITDWFCTSQCTRVDDPECGINE